MDKIIFFDGVCNLCSKSVNFIIDQDKDKIFKFAALQSDFTRQLFANPQNQYFLFSKNGLQPINESTRNELNSLNSILYLENKILYQKSDAALCIVSHLGWKFQIISFTKILPVSFRNFLYDWIARNRYNWFGKLESCRMPTPKLKERFLD